MPISASTSRGVTVTREELSRDDSLVKYLELNGLYGVEMGKKDRGTIARVFVDVSRVGHVGAVLGGRLEPVSVGQRQSGRVRPAGVHRPGRRTATASRVVVRTP